MADITERLRTTARQHGTLMHIRGTMVDAAQEIDMLRAAFNPAKWSPAMTQAWQSAMPDKAAAFAALLQAVYRS